jgi:hypothetical protein
MILDLEAVFSEFGKIGSPRFSICVVNRAAGLHPEMRTNALYAD